MEWRHFVTYLSNDPRINESTECMPGWTTSTSSKSKQNLYAVTIMANKRWLHYTDVDPNSPVSVHILHGADAARCATHMMFMNRQRNARVTPTTHQRKGHVTFQDVKIPRDHTPLLCHSYQNLQDMPVWVTFEHYTNSCWRRQGDYWKLFPQSWKYCPMPKAEGSISNWGEIISNSHLDISKNHKIRHKHIQK